MVAYLDHAATTPVRPQAIAAWHDAPPGNASSLHATGRRARRVLEEARESIADDLGVAAGDVIITSGGTLADNLAITGIHTARRAANPSLDTVVISAVEHHAVADTARALPHTRLLVAPVDPDGRLDLDAFARLVAAESRLASVWCR